MNLSTLVAGLLGVSVEQLESHIAARAAAARARVQRNNDRYEADLRKITDVQAVVCEKLEAQGFKRQNGIRVSRVTGLVAVFYQKQVWDGARGKLGLRLTAVYPDGSQGTTLEKSISVKSF